MTHFEYIEANATCKFYMLNLPEAVKPKACREKIFV